MKSILNHGSIRSIKKPDSDISAFDFSSNVRNARCSQMANLLLHHDRGRYLVFCQIKFNNFLSDRYSGNLTFRIRNGISGFSKFAYPVIKGSGIDTLFLTSLIIGKTALEGFHDKFDLFWFSHTVRIHNVLDDRVKRLLPALKAVKCPRFLAIIKSF